MSLKHLFVGQSDYAACGQMFARSLEVLGHETRSYTTNTGPFHYPDYPKVLTGPEWRAYWPEMIEWADWVWLVQSDLPKALGGFRGNRPKPYYLPPMGDTVHNSLKKKQLVALHGGGHYRKRRYAYAQAFPDAISICYSADLMGAYKREHLIVPPVDLRYFKPKKRTGAMVVGHYPSRVEDKGTAMIERVMANRGIEFKRGGRAKWSYQLRRMRECDVIIDQIQHKVNDLKVGEWVSIATEAAALGCVSIANSLNPQPYVETYGEMPGIHICNDEQALSQEIDRLNGLSRSRLEKEKTESRAWIERHHSLEATARILDSLLF